MGARGVRSGALFAHVKPRAGGKRDRVSFEDVLERAAMPAWETEYRFDAVRRWRFDFAWPAFRIAMEIEGGSFGRLIVIDRGWRRGPGGLVHAIAPGTRIRIGGRHQSGPGFERDLEKYNRAILGGWLLLRATPTQVRDGHALAILREAFTARGLE